jgi:hypothetical protein
LIHDYLWDAQETGGFYEGYKVLSVTPGVGMLANGLLLSQVLPFVPNVDEGGWTRSTSPGAGAFTHYHNYTYYVRRGIPAGGEVFVNYGDGWFEERKHRLVLTKESPSSVGKETGSREERVRTRSTEWLSENGLCLDNLKPGSSTIEHAGRGAFAARLLTKGSIVAPVPVLPITKRDAMDMARERHDETTVETKQLLLNYCLGNKNSSLLLYPYGPHFNLVNHASNEHANVQLQWSESKLLHFGRDWLDHPLDFIGQQNRSGLLLELVALRDIQPNEEILLDYGTDWLEAWRVHVESWKAVAGADRYAPAFVQDDAIQALRTEAELKNHPYPANVFTSCFYRYTDNKQRAETFDQSADSVTTFKWNMTRGIYELKNLRPCSVLKREQTQKQGTVFTVQMRNRFGLDPMERIPKGKIHIVTHVPRQAIRFSDFIFTTDQHLENAFRHPIGLPEGLWPEQWKDLKAPQGGPIKG